MVNGVFIFLRGSVSSLILGSGNGDSLLIRQGVKVLSRGTETFEYFPEEVVITNFPEKMFYVVLAAIASGHPLQLGFTNSSLDSATITSGEFS